MMYPDNIPNNHILNTLLTKCSMIIFGKEQWAIRLPNLLSFIGFGFGVFQILKLVLKPASYFFLPAAILFVNPYLLDFFGLCRGYGISEALITLSVGFLLNGYINRKAKFMWYALLTSILASYANFSVLLFWVTVTILVCLYFFIQNKKDLRKILKPALFIFLISVAYLALIIVPIMKMQSANEFQYWTSKGFYDETIKSLLIDWWYDSEILSAIDFSYWTGALACIVLFNILYFLRNIQKNKWSIQGFYHPIFLATVLLILPAIINIVQSRVLGTPNLNGRTALFFYPLVSLVFVNALGLIPASKRLWVKSLAVLAGLIFIINLSSRVTVKSVKEWSYDQSTLDVMNFIKEKYDGKPISFRTSWYFHPSFYFYSYTGKAPWIDLQGYNHTIDITTRADYYYVFAEDYKLLEPRFEIAYKFSPDRWLLKQKIR
jgi:hypothetical protein